MNQHASLPNEREDMEARTVTAANKHFIVETFQQWDHQTIREMIVLSRCLTAERPIKTTADDQYICGCIAGTERIFQVNYKWVTVRSMSGAQQQGGISSNILPLLPLDDWTTKWDVYFVSVNRSTLSPFAACITEQSWVSVWHPCQLCVLDDFNIIVLLEGCNLCYGFTVNVIQVLPSRSVLCYKIRQLYKSYLQH